MFLLLQNLIRSFLFERKDFVFVFWFFFNNQRTKEESFLNDFEATTSLPPQKVLPFFFASRKKLLLLLMVHDLNKCRVGERATDNQNVNEVLHHQSSLHSLMLENYRHVFCPLLVEQ